MKVRALYDILFTEYPGHLGFAPALLTLVACVAVCGGLLYGGALLGKAIADHAHAPTVETGHS